MIYAIKFLYSFFLPPGIFILLLWAAVFWLYKKRNKNGARLALIFSLLLYLLSTTWIGQLAIHQLEYAYTPPPQKPNGDVIVMLGGGGVTSPDMDGTTGILSGAASNRLLTAARLQIETNLPLIISGGQVYPDTGNEGNIAKRQLLQLGIPENKIIIDDKSLNTEQNAKYTKKLMEKHHFEKPILVTSAFHMKRSVLCFEKVGIPVVPFPADYRTGRIISVYLNKFAPGDFENLHITAKEWLGILVIKLKMIGNKDDKDAAAEAASLSVLYSDSHDPLWLNWDNEPVPMSHHFTLRCFLRGYWFGHFSLLFDSRLFGRQRFG
ncbi:YdcF family protein [Falsibacillus pallidus]|uniref:YdcF family protein n=1 Tax=Falsibacillus pallidus TaxID=493781 RepID=UPI003D95FDDC